MTDPSTLPIATPWGQSDLQRLVFDDVMPGGFPINTRAAAMRIPAAARARNLLVATGSRLPLQCFRGEERLVGEAEAPWLFRTGSSTSWQLRNAWTIDDLIWYGWSCWWRTNGADGFPLTADRINQGDWQITSDNRMEVNGEVVPDNRVILIPGLHEGVLSYGVDAIRDTKRLYQIVRDRLENPTPSLDLHQVDGDELTKAEREELLTDWRAARKSPGGAGVGFSNSAIEVRELGAGSGEQLLIEARNAAALDVARVVGVGASRIDATAPKASLNYETTTGRNQELVDFDLALYLSPIAARLSLDDVVPRGQRVAFDYSELIDLAPSLTGPATQD